VVPPEPAALIESLRSVGYTLPTALADILDNSIAAQTENIDIAHEAAITYREAIKAAAAGVLPARLPAGVGVARAGGHLPAQTLVPADDDIPVVSQADFLRKLTRTGEIPPKLWINFYPKVLSKHAADSSLKLKVTFESSPTSGISKEKIEETRTALKELGLGNGELKSE
jgi:hypothetical protein